MPLAFDIGDTVKLLAEITDDDDTPADPTDLEATIIGPDGDVVALTPQEVETGLWKAEHVVDQEGSWWYRFYDAGPPSFAEESSFIVKRQRVAEQGS